MTTVNVPVLFLLYGAAVSGVYGAVGAGLWMVGRLRDDARYEGGGRHLVTGGIGTFLAYAGYLVGWMVLPLRGTESLAWFYTAILLGPLVLLAPPAWATYRYATTDSP